MSERRLLLAYEWAVSLSTLALLTVLLAGGELTSIRPEVFAWILLVALVELRPVPLWSLQVSVGYPVLLTVAFLYQPAIAGAVAMLSCCDPRELRGEVHLAQAMFNRSQVTLSILCASSLFHLASNQGSGGVWAFVGVVVAVGADYVVNVALVGVGLALNEGMRLRDVLPRFLIGNRVEFLVSYLGLGALGVVMAKLYLEIGFWSVALFVAPLFLARQMFFRSQALEEAHRELKQREVLLQRLSDRLAEERQDERLRIADYLHDDLAQLLFQLSLQADLAERFFGEGDVERARAALGELRHTKSVASERMRSLVQDLHRSPLGRKGLAEALRSFAIQMQRDSDVQFTVDVEDLPLGPPIQLLVYQIAHEAVMNALKYAEPRVVEVMFWRQNADILLTVTDDGAGFDAEAGEPDGHYGLTMMHERANAVGGTFDIVSATGHGTAITVKIPTSWLLPLDQAQQQAERQHQQQRVAPFDGASR